MNAPARSILLATIGAVAGAVLLAAAIGSTVGVYASEQHQDQVHPAPASEQAYQAAIHAWLVAFRSITDDHGVQLSWLHKTAAHLRVDDPARNVVRDGLQARNPFLLMQDQTTQVTVGEIARDATNAWHATWTERSVDSATGAVQLDTYSATINTEQAPVSKDQMLLNPFGIYIAGIDYQRTNGA